MPLSTTPALVGDQVDDGGLTTVRLVLVARDVCNVVNVGGRPGKVESSGRVVMAFTSTGLPSAPRIWMLTLGGWRTPAMALSTFNYLVGEQAAVLDRLTIRVLLVGVEDVSAPRRRHGGTRCTCRHSA